MTPLQPDRLSKIRQRLLEILYEYYRATTAFADGGGAWAGEDQIAQGTIDDILDVTKLGIVMDEAGRAILRVEAERDLALKQLGWDSYEAAQDWLRRRLVDR